MRTRVPPFALAFCVLGAASGSSDRAWAQEVAVHGELSGIHAVGNTQGSLYGFGVEGAAKSELTFARILGVQVEGAGLGLPRVGTPPAAGTPVPGGGAVTVMLGLRLHPFGRSRAAGLWLDGDAGTAFTEIGVRPAFDFDLGYDFRIGRGRLDIGPFLGDTHLFQPPSATVPGDCHVLRIGIHLAFGAPNPG